MVHRARVGQLSYQARAEALVERAIGGADWRAPFWGCCWAWALGWLLGSSHDNESVLMGLAR